MRLKIRKLYFCITLVVGVFCLGCRGGGDVAVVDKPASDGQRNKHYITNRSPLPASPFAKLPIGSVKPEGWLKKQLELQADGLNGHLMEISRFCDKDGNSWLEPQTNTVNQELKSSLNASYKEMADDSREGKDVLLGGKGYWEEVPYWLRGFTDLGYILDDKRINEESSIWIDAILKSQRSNGWIGPEENLKSPRFKPWWREAENLTGIADFWPNSVVLSTLRSYYEHSGDSEVIDVLLKYCDFMLDYPEDQFLYHWIEYKRPTEYLKNIFWLYNVTGEQDLLDLARKVYRCGQDLNGKYDRPHNVDIAQCFYGPALYSQLIDDKSYYEGSIKVIDSFYETYGQVPGGMWCGDEVSRSGYIGPRQAIETCGMVEMMHSAQQMFTRVDGNAMWADRCENIAFNSFPAALTADMKAIRYLTSPNMPVSDRVNKNPDIKNEGAMYVLNPLAHRCCQHNHGMGWPYYSEYTWVTTADNGLCAMLYSASEVTAKVGTGDVVVFKQETNYPFDSNIKLTVEQSPGSKFPLYLRIPGWSARSSVTINGREIASNGEVNSYYRIHRKWEQGDVVVLTLPREIKINTWTANKNCVSVNYGPLTFSVKIDENHVKQNAEELMIHKAQKRDDIDLNEWPAYEMFPNSPWNYGLLLNTENIANGFEIVERTWPVNNMPWTHEGTPIVLKTKAKRIPEWKLQENNMAGKIPQSPVVSNEKEETIEMIPMGAARLRISALPTIKN